MKYIFICCEGETEEAFVEKLLVPYFKDMGVYIKPIGIRGMSNFDKIKKLINRLYLSYPNSLVTTMIDYYGLQKVIPTFIPAEGDIYQRVKLVETKLYEALSQKNLYFNIVLHEFEGLLFSDVNAFDGIATKSQLQELKNIRRRAETPEHINDKYETAPSRQILHHIPDYSKIQNGIEVAQCIGIGKIAEECIHFGKWIDKLMDWAKE